MNLSNGMNAGTFCASSAGLAIGSTKTGIAIAAPNGAGVDFCINGVAYHKADAATAAITAASAQAALTDCIYLICLNASGTVSSVKGTEVLTASITNGDVALPIPLPLASTCPIGYVRVKTAAATTFTAGTTDFDATGVTASYVNLMTMPAQPLSA